MSNDSLVGQKILGYELQELIGSGGFGKVYKGVKKVGKDEYYAAIKHISLPKNNEYNDLLNSMGRNYEAVDKYYEKILEDMINEINTLFYLSKKDNKNIVTYYDHDIVKTENPLKYDIFIRMEYLKPLNIYSNEENMTIEDAINLGIDIARALDNCHKQGIIHRDVKDGNIFINEDGDFKLGDFGISRMLSDNNQTLSMKGTPIFMAPEVILGRYYDKTVDIYSLGIVLYRLLNYNRIPFLPKYPEIYTSRDTDTAMNRRLSGEKLDIPQNANDELGKVILKACDVQGSRYDSCEEFINDLLKVKNSMSKVELNKLLFEVSNSIIESKKEINMEDTYILTQENNDDTVILGYSSYERYEVNKYTDEEMDIHLKYDNESKFFETGISEDDTVLLNESININVYKKNVYNQELEKSSKGSKNKILSGTTLLISAGLICTLFIYLLIGTVKTIDNIDIPNEEINIVMEDLPKESIGIGNLSTNYIATFEDGTNKASIVSGEKAGYTYQGGMDGIVEYEYDGPTTRSNLTEYFSVCLNKVEDEIYHIKHDTSEVKKVNVKTGEINDVYGIKAKQIITLGNYIYYSTCSNEEGYKSDEPSGIYKVNILNGEKEIIIDGEISRFSINSDKILYQYYNSEDLYILDLNSNKLNELGIVAEYGKFALYENCLIYVSKGILYRSDISGENQEVIVESVKEFAIEGKYLHYINQKNNLYVADLSIGKVQDMGENVHSYLNVASDTIYTPEEGYSVYYMDNIFE